MASMCSITLTAILRIVSAHSQFRTRRVCTEVQCRLRACETTAAPSAHNVAGTTAADEKTNHYGSVPAT